MSATSFDRDSMPPKIATRLPRYPVPAVLLARLAVDSSYQNCGLGTKLLVDSFKKVIQVYEIIGIVAFIVDALDKEAASFYQKSKFMQFSGDELRLYLPMADIKDSFFRIESQKQN